jgi:hypothetical protein
LLFLLGLLAFLNELSFQRGNDSWLTSHHIKIE